VGTTRRRQAVSLLVAAQLFVACQTTSPNPSVRNGPEGLTASSAPIAVSPKPSSAIAALPPEHPLDITADLDTSTVAKAVIGIDGGTLRLNIRGGTTVILAIPKDALLSDTPISMTAVAKLDGWTFQPAEFASVQLEPDGLQLLEAATLTFDRPDAADPAMFAQVGWGAQGEDLHPILASSVANGVSIPIEHFSGYGFAWNTTLGYWGDWEVFRARTWEAFIESGIATVLGQERQRQFLNGGEESDVLGDLLGVISQWYDWVYSALMGAAGTSCDNAREAAIAQESFARMMGLLGIDMKAMWQRFSEARQEAGLPAPYTFDGLPTGFLATVIDICDKEALDECLLSGDLVLLVFYVRDRNRILELSSGGRPPGTSDGSNLLSACGKYRVDLDLTFANDRTLYGSIEGPPVQFAEQYERWRLRLSVDLQWTPAGQGREPWIGTITGKAIPESAVLEARHRDYDRADSDRGVIDKGWGAWCKVEYRTGTFQDWPVELTSLDFNRERDQRVLPPLPFWATGILPEPPGPTINTEGQLRTTSFVVAKLKFDGIDGPAESTSYRCATTSGAGHYASGGGGLGILLLAHPADANWQAGGDGLAPAFVAISKGGTHPVIAQVDWTTCAPPPPNPNAVDVPTCNGSLTLTHTAAPGG
jgi:hypothetical protein